MASATLSCTVSFRWWVKPILHICALFGMSRLPKWVRVAVIYWGVKIGPVRSEGVKGNEKD